MGRKKMFFSLIHNTIVYAVYFGGDFKGRVYQYPTRSELPHLLGSSGSPTVNARHVAARRQSAISLAANGHHKTIVQPS